MSRMKQILSTVSGIVILANIAIASDWRENAKAIDISGGEEDVPVVVEN